MLTPDDEIGIGGRVTTGSDHQNPKELPGFEGLDGDPYLSEVRGKPLPKVDPPSNLDDIVRGGQE